MHTIKWLSFFVRSGTSRTLLHLYPQALQVRAPYPALCRLSYFANGTMHRTVVVEGSRLGVPDGLWVEEIFPIALEKKEMFGGLQIEIATNQTHFDVAPSFAWTEIISGDYSARFQPALIRTSRQGSRTPTAIVLDDALTVSSLVVVNGLSGPLVPEVVLMPSAVPLEVGTVGQYEVCEVPLEAIGEDSGEPFSLVVLSPPRTGVAYFMLYRDASTGTPLSVVWL